MIRTISDLLNQFLEREKKLIEEQINEEKVKHRPTLGDAFEDLTREALEKVLPCDSLVVSSGFIRNAETGELTPELDCILSLQDGDQFRRTDKKIFNVEDVLAVIQVKKTLYGKQIQEGFDNLYSVIGCPQDYNENIWGSVKRVFQKSTGILEPDRITDLSPMLHDFHRMIATDANWPIRILIGYDGYKNETTLRKGLAKHIDKALGTERSGPIVFPNLILGPNASAVKAIGLPWMSQMIDGHWPMLLTTSVKPAVLFLESIWTRLVNRGFGNAGLFGDDLEQEIYHPLIFASANEKGWQYTLTKAKVEEIVEQSKIVPWQPIQVSKEAQELIFRVGRNQSVDVSKEKPEVQKEIWTAFEELRGAQIIGQNINNSNVLRLLTEKCDTAFLPDGRLFAGENNTGQLTRWIMKESERIEQQGE